MPSRPEPVDQDALGLQDLWTGERIEIGGGLGASVPAHGTAIYRVSAG